MASSEARTRVETFPVYAEELKKCKHFLKGFRGGADDPRPYMSLLQRVSDRKESVICIKLDDLHDFTSDASYPSSQWADFIKHIEENTLRYIGVFSEAVDQEMPSSSIPPDKNDVIEVLRRHRLQRERAKMDLPAHERMAEDDAGGGVEEAFPKGLMRRYELRILPRSNGRVIPLRQVRSRYLGAIVRVKGVVTRVTEVKPLVTVATYTCERCGFEIYQEVNSRVFMPLFVCPSSKCKASNSKGKLYLQTRGSKFVKYQQVKLQELAEEVPIGHTPTSLTIHVRGNLTRIASPGDVTTIDGIFLPLPFTGFKAIRAGLQANTFMEAMHIHKDKKSYHDYHLSKDALSRIQELQANGNAYERLSKSLAPEIFGCDDIKKVLLLQMVGGVTRALPDGMRIRGDINVCLMGDPGMAKSQLLKHISVVSPRGVYTSGKGSSGVGLTAAIIRDTVTNEFVLEGGSLVLADMGVCCIDEFDKMEEADRTAIHEVMEQQTISIAKAGITTTLNARTAILAAANPAYGRYNCNKTPEENINLPAALLSRFDVLYLILDKPSYESDLELARHVTHVHRYGAQPELEFEPLPAPFMREYIARARKLDPWVPRDLTDYIATAYVNMRAEEASMDEEARTYTTARSLLSILRLSQALARLQLATLVTREDVDEAMRLMHMSKSSLEMDRSGVAPGVDAMSAIYNIVRDYSAATRSSVVAYDDVLRRVLAKGYTQNQLNNCLTEYERIDVWQLSAHSREIRFA